MVALLEQAVQAQKNGDLVRAEKLSRRLLKKNENDKDANHLLGMLLAATGELTDAIHHYRRSLELDASQPAVHFNLGNALKRLGYDGALACYRRAIELHPGFVSAAVSLATELRHRGAHEEAAAMLVATGRQAPGDAKLAAALGLLRKELGDYSGAIAHYERALSRQPEMIEARHNLGVALRLANRPVEALEHYSLLLKQGVNDYQLLHNIANAYSDLGQLEQATAGYIAAIEQAPDYVHSHINLSTLRWERGDTQHFLESFEAAFAQGTRNLEMERAYLELLLRAERFSEIEVFAADLDGLGADAAHQNYLGRVAARQKRYEEAIVLQRTALVSEGGTGVEVVNFRLDLVAALLACGEWDAARVELDALLGGDSTHPLAVAYAATLWRLQDDPRRSAVADYASIVAEYDLPGVEESGRDDYLRELAAALGDLHTSEVAPLEQTLVSGTQTRGNLFGREVGCIAVLQSMVKEAVHDYVLKMREHPASQFMRLPEEISINASWSVQLKSSGYHTPHMHPLGAISGVYYVDIPDDLPDDGAGCLTLGQPGIDVGVELEPEYTVIPKPGKLVLFPSFLWHGTQPFTSQRNRLTIAFDVAPRARPNSEPSPLLASTRS